MSEPVNDPGGATTVADLNNPVLWSRVQATVLPKVRQALRHRFGLPTDAPDADDAVQSGVRALLAMNTRDELELTLRGLEGWLVRTAYRKLRDKYGRKSHTSEIPARELNGDSFADAEQTPLEQLLVSEANQRLDDLCAQLPEEQQLILRLWLNEQSQREIANALGITRARVEAALKAIFALARRLWGEDGT